jgi:hypothetical protein
MYVLCKQACKHFYYHCNIYIISQKTVFIRRFSSDISAPHPPNSFHTLLVATALVVVIAAAANIVTMSPKQSEVQ